MPRTPDGPPPAPVVQRLRVHFAKRGRLRFASHRDFQRAFERAVRRAELPIAFSAGFTPHPKISYAGAAPTGVASEAEYLEIGLAEFRDPSATAALLDDALPDGLDVVEVVESAGGALADRMVASLWRVELPGCSAADARAGVAAFLALAAAPVERLTKDGKRLLDARGPVLTMSVDGGSGGRENRDTSSALSQPAGMFQTQHAILHMVVRHVIPAVRPDDILTGVRLVTECVPPAAAVRVTRLAQGPLDESGRVADPLAPDRAAAAV